MERRRRRWWTFGLTTLASLVVAAAALSLASRFAFDAVPAYRARAQAWVSQALGRPARLGSIAMTWSGLQPTLDLSDIEVLDDRGAVAAQAARLRVRFSLLRLVSGDVAPSVAELYGVGLAADADAQGRWSLRGFGHTAAPGDDALLRQLSRFSEVRLVNCQADVHLPALAAAPLRLVVQRGTLRRFGKHYSLRAALLAPVQFGGGGQLEAHFSGDPAQPEAWHGSWSLDLGGFGADPGWHTARLPAVDLRLADARLSLSGTLRNSRPQRLYLNLHAASATAWRGGRAMARWDHPLLQAVASATGDDWHAQLNRLEYVNPAGVTMTTQGAVDYHADAASNAWSMSLERLQVDDLAPWLALLRGMPERVADLGGQLDDISLRYQDGAAPAQRFGGSLRLSGIALRGAGTAPGFSNFGGLLQLAPAGAHLQLQGAGPVLDLPGLFAHPLTIDALDAEVDIARDVSGWRVAAPRLAWQALGGNGSGQLEFVQPAAAPAAMRMSAEFSAADVDALKPYMLKHWGAGAREWLGRALQGGRIEHGAFRLDGPLDDYPFVEHPDGSFALDFDVIGTRLEFARGWPPLDGLRAHLGFRGHGLHIAGGGRLGAVAVEHVDADIPDLRQAELAIDGSSHADAAGYYAYLRASPLHDKLAGLLAQTEVGGPAVVDMHLQVPLEQMHDAPDVSFAGHVRFDGGSLQVGGIDRPVRQLRGSLQFGEHGVRGEHLSGELYGAALDAAVRPEGDSADGVVYLGFNAPVAPDDGLFAAFVPGWLRQHLRGGSHWNARLPLSGAHSGQLVLDSDLRGTAVDLPAPLAKAADDALPLTAIVRGAVGSAAGPAPLRVEIAAGERLRLALRFGGQGQATVLRAAELRLGDGAMPRADEDGLRLSGSAEEFDAGAWQNLSKPGVGSALAFLGADLSVQRLIYGGFAVRAVQLQAAPTADGWTASAEGTGASGAIDWSHGNGGALRARLQHLAMDPLTLSPSADQHAEPPFDPAQAPVVDFRCDALQLGEADLGHVILATQRVDGGQSLQQFSVQGPQLNAAVSGQWTRRDGASAAELEYSASINGVGKVLRGFGYAENLDAAKADISGHLSWPGQPDGLELAQARGTVTLKMHKGTLRAVNPGAGRVLGLLNLYALPRRLTLDFHDVVSKGLGFDSLTGSFALGDGQAVTSDMQLVSPSMRMEVRGRIGLAAHDYDQRVTVYPDVSTTVAVGATLIGGPIAGGVALLAQEIFNKPFNQLGHFSYHVTGTWDNPLVNGESKDAAPPEHKPDAPPSGEQSRRPADQSIRPIRTT